MNPYKMQSEYDKRKQYTFIPYYEARLETYNLGIERVNKQISQINDAFLKGYLELQLEHYQKQADKTYTVLTLLKKQLIKKIKLEYESKEIK
ncbi:MAG: hypothetical protein GF317_17065 [Candidatus Lokiarchaeota archaeon]|nr:hypothetical protein [Candidatus Lokiarchaeota archaeon]